MYSQGELLADRMEPYACNGNNQQVLRRVDGAVLVSGESSEAFAVRRALVVYVLALPSVKAEEFR